MEEKIKELEALIEDTGFDPMDDEEIGYVQGLRDALHVLRGEPREFRSGS